MLKVYSVHSLHVLLMLFIIKLSNGHTSSSESASTSSENNIRRNMVQEWQYEGMPIPLPGRKAGTDELSSEVFPEKTTTSEPSTTTTTTTTSTTPRPYPPLNKRYRRIYNPDEVASVEDYPFMAALLVNDELWCGGAIIDSDAVITAAHCLQLQYNNRFFREYVKMLSVRVGSDNATAGGEVLRVVEIFFHPNYKPQNLEFNIAVLKLDRNLTLGRNEPLLDSIAYTTKRVVPTNRNIVFLGWGSVMSVGGAGGQVLLQKIELPVYEFADCQDVYGRDLVTRNSFCAGYISIPKNVCNHDAGGPAIMDGFLVGILSFSAKRCDEADKPAVFSNVGAVSSWLAGLGDKKLQLRETALKADDFAV